MSYPTILNKYKQIDTIDIREDSLAENKQNYLETKINEKYDIIITNPPFNQAVEIIEKSINDVKDGGLVIMLLRLNFMGSKKRRLFWEKNKPSYIYVHSDRMSFTDDGKRDSIEYAHFVWIKNKQPEFAQIKII
jgi:23S rRNA A1618 N6-methylase RlmF